MIIDELCRSQEYRHHVRLDKALVLALAAKVDAETASKIADALRDKANNALFLSLGTL